MFVYSRLVNSSLKDVRIQPASRKQAARLVNSCSYTAPPKVFVYSWRLVNTLRKQNNLGNKTAFGKQNGFGEQNGLGKQNKSRFANKRTTLKYLLYLSEQIWLTSCIAGV